MRRALTLPAAADDVEPLPRADDGEVTVEIGPAGHRTEGGEQRKRGLSRMTVGVADADGAGSLGWQVPLLRR